MLKKLFSPNLLNLYVYFYLVKMMKGSNGLKVGVAIVAIVDVRERFAINSNLFRQGSQYF